MPQLLLRLYTVIVKDFRVDARRKTEAASATVFSIAASIVVSYTLSRGGETIAGQVVGALLVMVFLSVFASLASFIREKEEGTLEGLRLAPVPSELIFLAKTVYSFTWIAIQVVIYLLSFTFFSQAGMALSPILLLALFATALYLSAVSSLASAILVYSEARSILLPVTILVLALPYLQSIVQLMLSVQHGRVDLFTAVEPLAAAIAFIALSILLARYVLEVL